MTTETPTIKRRSRLKTPGIALAAGILGLIIGSAGGSASDTTSTGATPASTVTVTAAAAAPASAQATTVSAKAAGPSGSIPEDGTFLVGSDVKPGTYKAPGGDLCYWARLKDVSGQGIIINGVGGGQQIVSVKSSDRAFQTRGCGAWAIVGAVG